MILGILCFDLEIWISFKNQEIWVAWAFSTKVLFVCVSVYMTHELAHTDDAFIVIISHFPSYVIKMKTAIIVKLLFLYTYIYAYTTFYLRLWIMMDITHETLNVFSVRFFFSLSFTILGLLAQLFRFTWVYTNECETHGLFPFACVAAWFFFLFSISIICHKVLSNGQYVSHCVCLCVCFFACQQRATVGIRLLLYAASNCIHLEFALCVDCASYFYWAIIMHANNHPHWNSLQFSAFRLKWIHHSISI